MQKISVILAAFIGLSAAVASPHADPDLSRDTREAPPEEVANKEHDSMNPKKRDVYIDLFKDTGPGVPPSTEAEPAKKKHDCKHPKKRDVYIDLFKDTGPGVPPSEVECEVAEAQAEHVEEKAGEKD